jgi:ubiquinone/menaquinone biosynthesis C-methylase UbiE
LRTSPSGFDDQAAAFDERAGLPEFAAEAIARAVSELGQMRSTDLLLEIGAGTGQIGCHLGALPGRYVGFDASPAMLEVFAQRCRVSGFAASFLRADGSARWPVDDGAVTTFFSSRAIHLLAVEHVLREIFRAAAPTGAHWVVGRVRRAPESLRSRLRHEMRERLRQLGFAPGEGREREREILEACRARGAISIEPVMAAAWPVSSSGATLLHAWQTKAGLAGLDIPAPVKASVLSHLGKWCVENFGALATVHEAEEKYILEGVRLPPK